MSRAEPVAPRGATGRADLLRALAAAPRDRLAIDDDGDSWFGYIHRQEFSPPSEPEPPRAPSAGAAPAPVPGRNLPLRMPFLYAIVRREGRAAPEPESQDQDVDLGLAPVEDSAEPFSAVRLVGYEDLVPQARLLPALRRLLGATRAGALDLEQLTQRLAAGELPRHLPRRKLRRWHPDLVVLLDFSQRLWPYREDMHRLAERLLRHCGRSGVSLRVLKHGPFGLWSDWLAHQNPQSSAEPLPRSWILPVAGTPVLIVSDLGLLLGAQSSSARDWASFLTRLRCAQARPLVLAPLGARQLEAAGPLPVLRWSPDAPTRVVRTHGPSCADPKGLADLLAMVAATRRVDPPLLRALRRLNPGAPLDAGLEGALWCHADVEAGASASIRHEAQARHLGRFARLVPHLQRELNSLRQRHHAHLRAYLNHEETLLWESHSSPDATQAFAGNIKAAGQAMRKLASSLARRGASPEWWAVARAIEERTDEKMGRKHANLLTPLVAARMCWALERGMNPDAPEWVDPMRLAGLLQDGGDPVHCWLVQDGASASLVLQGEPAGLRQSPLGEGFMLDAGGMQVRAGDREHGDGHWVGVASLPAVLAPLQESTELRLETARETITVAEVRRPRGAIAWGCDGNGFWVCSPPLAGREMRWSGDTLRAVSVSEEGTSSTRWVLEADSAAHPKSGGILQFGIDTHFGVYANLNIATKHGEADPVVQRLRWIEPGTFLMGSPEDEPGRSSEEGSQHAVTLTQGFWLADTACTQGLWQVVMGSNPSRFTGDVERPVENVSWDDTKVFLQKLEALLPGCGATLPTEAQWEYACRAGTDTPFSFGAQITPELVNYDGNYPYAGGEKGLYREQTVPVKSLPPNGWGLYEMHGNVWEWCTDGLRDYDGGSEEDPLGPVQEGDDALRAVRGGSWVIVARGARSAYRNAWLPGYRYVDQGLRLCLRSNVPGQEQGRPGGPSGIASGGRTGAATPARDEPGWRRAKRALRLPDWLRPNRDKNG